MTVERLTSEAMLALAAELAPLVGPKWSAAPDKYDHDGSACLVRADGAELGLEQGRWPRSENGRLLVVGRYPSSKDRRVFGPPWGTERTRITVDMGRGAAAIARDILRRFLPTYLDGFRKTQEAIRDHHEDLREAERVAIRIAVAAGTVPERWGGSKEVWAIRTVDGLIKVRDSHRESPHITIQLDGVDVEHAEAIARAYRPLEDVVREVFDDQEESA